jgi:hypothetical protein
MSFTDAAHRWRKRLLFVGAAITLSAMAFQSPASAATGCIAFTGTSWNAERANWSNWATGNDYRAPSKKSGTHAGPPTWTGTVYNKELWKGPTFRCPVGATSCDYSWGQTHSSTSQWSVGPWIQGSSGSSAKSWAWMTALIPNYGKTSTYTTTYTYTVHLKPGRYAQPYQATKLKPEAGHMLGAYVSPGSQGTTCTYAGGRGTTNYGFSAEWRSDAYAADWHANIRQWDFNSYYVWT